MSPDFDSRLHAMAEVIVRIGLNLQPGQPLLITEPYELQGIHPEAGPIVGAIRSVAQDSEVAVISADPARLRALVEADDRSGFEALVSNHTRRLEQHLAQGGAFLFLVGSQPRLMSGLPAERLAAFDRIKWSHLGPVIQRLVRGASQWTLAPAPSTAWADAAYAGLPAGERLPALWQTVFEAMRVCPAVGATLCCDPADIPSRGKPAPTIDSINAWHAHLASLARRRDELNAARHRQVRYPGPDTNLVLGLPRSHVWCTAQLVSKRGVPFVANLPTEEVFTAPHKSSAIGSVQVSRPVVHGGTVIDGIELEFRHGRVVAARSTTGQDALQHLLATDDGADRIGEVAIVPGRPGWASVPGGHRLGEGCSTPTPVANGDIGDHPKPRLFHHTLLDENAANHIALGDAYPFCSRALLPLALNHSQIHLDLPLDATVELS